jgi:glycosyltransferase involved in cell wall biosynthesis
VTFDAKISLIIPTYNRADLLKRALESALDLDYPREEYEIIVVDNNSSDGTAAVVKETQRNHPEHRLICVSEGRLGLHNARHAGTYAARGSILLFTDDDATFDRDWLRAYAEAFDVHPEMAAAGGPVRAFWETPPPPWLIAFMGDEKTFGMFSLMEPFNNFRLMSDGMFFGVNMAIRRDILIKLGGFNPEAFGDTWLGDGETGLVYKLWDQKLLIGYVPGALVHHHISPTRMTVQYLRRRMGNQGMCDLYSQFHRHLPKPASIIKQAARLALTQANSWMRASWARNRTDVRSLSLQLEAARTSAQLRYMLKIALSKKSQAFVAKENWLSEFGPVPNPATVPER